MFSDTQQKKVKKELIKHGASVEQAQSYVDLVRRFERESAKEIESINYHHILPRNCGWWKKYSKCKWNLVRVRWGLHLALHAYLANVFSGNIKFILAFRRTASHVVARNPKMQENKEKIIRQYQGGKSATKIATVLKTHPTTILDYLHHWSVHVRTHGESQRNRHAVRHKNKIIRWYRQGRSPWWMSKRIPVCHTSIILHLKLWGIKTHTIQSRGEAYSKTAKSKSQIIKWYKEGKSTHWISRRLGVGHGIHKWLRKWGVKLRAKHQIRSERIDRHKHDVVSLYKAGFSSTQIAEKIGIAKYLIPRWMESYGIGRRNASEAARNRFLSLPKAA